jgi:hypothetical protein
MSPLDRALSRRHLLETLGLAGSALLAGCLSSPIGASSTGTSTATSASGHAARSSPQPALSRLKKQAQRSRLRSSTWRKAARPSQTPAAAGRATFKTIYRGWYQGRAAHIHVQGSRRRSVERLFGDADDRRQRLTPEFRVVLAIGRQQPRRDARAACARGTDLETCTRSDRLPKPRRRWCRDVLPRTSRWHGAGSRGCRDR